MTASTVLGRAAQLIDLAGHQPRHRYGDSLDGFSLPGAIDTAARMEARQHPAPAVPFDQHAATLAGAALGYAARALGLDPGNQPSGMVSNLLLQAGQASCRTRPLGTPWAAAVLREASLLADSARPEPRIALIEPTTTTAFPPAAV